MEIKSNNKTLYDFNEQAKALRKTLVGNILNGRMKDFTVKHFSLIQTLEKRLQYLNNQYFVFADGKMKMKPVFERKPRKFLGIKIGTILVNIGKEEPVLMPGKVMEDYEKEFNKLMAEEVILQF